MNTNLERIHNLTLASVYKFYVPKAQKGGYGQAEVDQVICWLTGYNHTQLQQHLQQQTTFQDFFNHAPQPNPHRALITGKICGVQIEAITDPVYQEMRRLDKLVDELAKGRPLAKILRQA